MQGGTGRQQRIPVQRDQIPVLPGKALRLDRGISEGILHRLAFHQLHQGLQPATFAFPTHMHMICQMIHPFPVKIEKRMAGIVPQRTDGCRRGTDDLLICGQTSRHAVPVIAQQQKMKIGIWIGFLKDGQLPDGFQRMGRIQQHHRADHKGAGFIRQRRQRKTGHHSRQDLPADDWLDEPCQRCAQQKRSRQPEQGKDTRQHQNSQNAYKCDCAKKTPVPLHLQTKPPPKEQAGSQAQRLEQQRQPIIQQIIPDVSAYIIGGIAAAKIQAGLAYRLL